MKCLAILLCVLVGSAYSVPVQPSRTSALDLLDMLEKIVQDEGHELITKVVQSIHKVEDGVVSLKELVPKTYEKIHQEADKILEGLKKVSEEIEALLGKKTGKIYYGFDLLNGLTELTGGTKLSTVISLLQLADRAHKVMQDAKEFVPHLTKELNIVQGKIEVHVTELVKHVVKEMGVQQFLAHSVVKKIEDLVDEVNEEAHALILDLLHQIEKTFDIMKEKLPEIYKHVEAHVEEIREESHNILNEIMKRLRISSNYNLLDFAGDLTSGTSLGTAIRVMSVIDKFNVVVQDVKNFGPNAEVFIEHSVQKVADKAQEFLNHAAGILAKE